MEHEYQVEKKISVEKGRQGLLKVIFGRTTIIILIILAQLLFLLASFYFLQEYVLYAYWMSQLMMTGIVIHIINKAGSPEFKMAWIVPILVLPIFGSLLYLFFHLQAGGNILNRRIQTLEAASQNYLQTEPALKGKIKEEDPELANLTQYLENHGSFPTFRNTTVKYFPSGEDKFEELKFQLQKAKKFIFLEYFIIEEGIFWDSILEVLKKKVAEGVEVRLMYDGTCTLALLPPSYPALMKSYGIACKVFAPIRPALTTSQNNRDHRKIVVIDSKTAFVGGVNLADEYINKKARFGHWKDTAVMLRGEAVRSFTEMFLQMWNTTTRHAEDYSNYLEYEGFLGAYGAPGYVIPYGDNPFDRDQVGEMVYINMLNMARRYVHIMTPYLILSQEMLVALTFAAKRGVDVKIIMPHIPDKVYAFALAKTYYPQLIEAGVQIYEYTPGFVHAKVFVSDDHKAVVGTINLDFRSLYLHFECAVYMHDVPQIKDIEADYQATMAKSEMITLKTCKKEKLYIKALGKMLRLFAPLM